MLICRHVFFVFFTDQLVWGQRSVPEPAPGRGCQRAACVPCAAGRVSAGGGARSAARRAANGWPAAAQRGAVLASWIGARLSR